jgi:8-oxo-dGTP pyrophosphatase MutT (NUDIX family)
MARRAEPPPTHAGGVVARLDAAPRRYLLVRARRDPTQWIFPKGHVERGETPEEAAVREVREEAGVHARVLQPLGRLALPDGDVLLFLMRYEGEAGGGEGREIAWCDVDDARRRLTFPDARRILSRAHRARPAPGS